MLRTSAKEKLAVKSGDVLVVVHDQAGRIVLQIRRAARRNGVRSYLTPRALSAAARSRLYAERHVEWDKVEAEAAALGRSALGGRKLEDL